MEYKLLSHDEYSHPDHPPAERARVGDTMILAFKGVGDYKVTEPRLVRVLSVSGDELEGELIQPGMMIPLSVGERIAFQFHQAFYPPPFGDETFFGVPDV